MKPRLNLGTGNVVQAGSDLVDGDWRDAHILKARQLFVSPVAPDLVEPIGLDGLLYPFLVSGRT